ncbi:MAG TPA: hypothetical protein VHC47_07900 [Mucilaginibacter sp.]|nr:hypothetical protein [Mucilaginibacter sp.]
MTRRQHPVNFREILGPYTGTWLLIIIHLFILAAVVILFHKIILKIEQF